MNLKSEKLLIDETDHVEKRIERSEEARQKAVGEQAEISEHVQKLEAEKESNAMASLAEQQKLYGLFVLLAAVLFVADLPIQYGLNSVAFAKLSWLFLVVLSVLIAAGLGVVVEVTAFAMFFDPYRPRRTVRLCLSAAGISGGLAAVAATILLFSRTATGQVVEFLAQAVPVSLWVLGECLPVAAGFLSAAAWTLGYPKRRDDRIDCLKARLSELGRFLDWIDRDKQKFAMRAVSMVLVTVLLAAPAFSMGGHIRRVPILSANPQIVTNAKSLVDSKGDRTSKNKSQASEGNRCLIYLDMTESVDLDFRRQAVARVGDTLPQIINVFGCSLVGVGTFADEGPYSPLMEIPLVPPPQAGDCSKASYTLEGLQKLTQGVSGFEDYYQKRAETICRERAEAQFATFHRKSEETIIKIRSALNPDLPTRGRCTAIYGLLARALTRATTLILITDGVETCERNPQPIMLPEHRQVIFVLLPSRGHSLDVGRTALRLEAEWQRRIVGLQVILPSDISPRLWEEISAKAR